MHIITIIFIGIGLAMDCFAVSISSGISIRPLKISNIFIIPLFFSFFQMLMLLIGWSVTLSFRDFIAAFDHWFAFGLLTLVAIKMFYDAFKKQGEKEIPTSSAQLNIYIILLLSIATSIDALAVGISFAFLKFPIITSILIIGIITFILSFVGIFVGNTLGKFFHNKVKIISGLILLGIGIKILMEHFL